MFDLIGSDIQQYQLRQPHYPAWFLLLTKQGLWASLEYRFSHWVRVRVQWPIVRPLLRGIGFVWHKLIEILTGIDLPSQATIGPGLYIPHFGQIIVHCQAQIGAYCTLSQGVTIGEAGRGAKLGVPVIGSRVYIAPGAKIAGRITIADDVAIGANAVVLKSLPRHAVAVGVPAQVISYAGSWDFLVLPPLAPVPPVSGQYYPAADYAIDDVAIDDCNIPDYALADHESHLNADQFGDFVSNRSAISNFDEKSINL
jgi:serine O-acetyltransferase